MHVSAIACLAALRCFIWYVRKSSLLLGKRRVEALTSGSRAQCYILLQRILLVEIDTLDDKVNTSLSRAQERVCRFLFNDRVSVSASAYGEIVDALQLGAKPTRQLTPWSTSLQLLARLMGKGIS